MENIKLTDQEEKFCLVFACGPSPYNGNARKTFDLVFNGNTGMLFDPSKNGIEEHTKKEVDVAIAVRQLVLRDDIRDRIDQLKSETLVDATTLRPRLTETLLKIADECSTLMVVDRWGNTQSPAALRSVAVNAISKLTDMYGIKEDIAHKVMLEGADGDGITFNLIVPEANKENGIDKVIE
ncbi:MAG: hypothetical protein HDS02_03255 [Bacteroides sp.]|nr:hypothetical protein [Bacteroides sp.]